MVARHEKLVGHSKLNVCLYVHVCVCTTLNSDIFFNMME